MMNAHVLSTYLLGAAHSFYPVSNHHFHEKTEITEIRYAQFAEDMAEFVMDPNVEPLFGGIDGRIQTGLLLVSLASFESMFIEEVMTCKRLGDQGHAYGPFQSHIRKTEACAGNKQAAQVALDMIRNSFHVCHGLKQIDRLAVYTDGNNWDDKAIWKRSEQRMNRAMDFFSEHKPQENNEIQSQSDRGGNETN